MHDSNFKIKISTENNSIDANRHIYKESKERKEKTSDMISSFRVRHMNHPQSIFNNIFQPHSKWNLC